jgi:WD40 repeat protein
MKYILALTLFISFFTLIGQSKKAEILKGQIGDYKGNVVDLCLTPSGKVLIVPEYSRICFYDINSKALLNQLESGHSKLILTLDISSDSTLLSSGGLDSTVIIHNIESGKIERKFNDQNGVITSLAFSPDNTLLASGSSDKTVVVYDLSKGVIKYKLDGFLGDITSVKFSPGNHLLAVASLDKSIKIFNSISGRLIATLDGHNNSVRDVIFDKDGTILYSCGDDSRMIKWNIRDLNHIKIENKKIYKPRWLLTIDVNSEAIVISGLGSKIRVLTNYVTYEGRIGVPVNKVLFVPNLNSQIKLAIAIRNTGVFLINMSQFKTKF